MKRLIVLFVMMAIKGYGQSYFEGKIIFNIEYSTTSKTIPVKDYEKHSGTHMEFYIKGGNYKAIYNGDVLEWRMFLSKDNKAYRKWVSSDTVKWVSGTRSASPLIKTARKPNVATVLDYNCDQTIFTYADGSRQVLLGSKKILVDPKLFTRGVNSFFAATGMMFLQDIEQSKDLTITVTAVKVIPLKLDDKMFTLDPKLITAEEKPAK